MQKTKKVVSIILAVMMVVSMFALAVPVSALDETDAAVKYTKTNGSVVYGETFNKCSTTLSNGTYEVLKDFTNTSRWPTGTFGATATIDLGGHTVTFTNNDSFCSNIRGGKITVKNGTIVFDTGYANGQGFQVSSGSALVIESDATLIGTGTTSPVTVIKGTLDTEGTLIAENTFAIATNGSSSKDYTINVNGGSVSSTGAAAIYQCGDGTLNITDGNITGTTGVYVKSGNTNITGGNITGTGADADYTYNGNGANSTGDAIVVDNCGYPGGTPDVSISGGNFVSVNADAVGSYSNGTGNEPVDDFVAGGTFSSDVTAYVDPATNTVTEDGGTYSIGVKEGSVASVKGKGYPSLAEAVVAAGAGETVVLLADMEVTSFEIPASKNFTLDFNGHTITATTHKGIVNNGTLTLTDSNPSITGKNMQGSEGFILNKGTLNIEGGYYVDEQANNKCMIYNDNGTVNVTGGTLNANGYVIWTYGTESVVNVSGGTLKSTNASAISGNGTSTYKGYTINVSGGEVISENDTAIYHPNEGTLNITGGHVVGKTAVYTKAGVTNISDGFIESTGAQAPYSFNGNGGNPTGDALVIDNCDYPGQTPVVSVTGGDFKANGEGTKAVASYVKQDDPNYSGANQERVENFVSGGTFNTPVPADYCADDFAPVANGDGTYGVTAEADVVATNVNTGANYTDLGAAFADASNGDTIQLVDDVNIGNNYYYVTKDITIDLNGKTVTGADSFVIASADVTITNGTVTSTIANDYVLYANPGSKLTIADDATIKATNANGNAIIARAGSEVDIEGTIESGYYSVVAFGTAVVNVEDGATITSTNASCLSGNGSGGNEGYTFNVKGGTLTSTNDVAIYHPNQGSLIITGGTIKGATAIYIKSGSTDVSTSSTSINGATIIGTGAATALVHSNNGCNPNGDAIVIENCGYPGGTPDIGVSGGTIISENANDIGSYGYGSYEAIDKFVSGGSFAHEVPEEQCAAGFEPKTELVDGMYTVQVKENPLDDFFCAAPSNAPFGVTNDYLVGTLLGFQKKAEVTSESGQETGKDVRFVSVISKDMIALADDYGYVVANAGDKTLANINNIDIVKPGNIGKTISAKDTSNNIFESTSDYEYVTCAVNGVAEGKNVLARFYVTINGKTYFAKYPQGGSFDGGYRACVADYNTIAGVIAG